MTKRYFRAKMAWIEGSHFARNVVVCVANGVVADIVRADQFALGASEAFTVDVDLLLPGFINAHSHLEYSYCRGKLPRGKVAFAQWIEALNSLKASTSSETVQEAARSAIAEMARGGTTTVLDCAQDAVMSDVLARGPLRYFLFWEVLGLTPERATRAMTDLVRKLDLPRGPRCLGVGINPHAPYSVGGDLRNELRDFLSLRRDLSTAWHIAETREELELFQEGTGPLADFFERHGFPFPFEEPPHDSPLRFLTATGLFERCDLVFHLNFFSKEDGPYFIAPRGVVHCPGTHRYFERDTWPLMTLLTRGGNVCLGTDSLASADTLDLFSLLQQLGRDYPALTGIQLLDFVTRNPARTKPLVGHKLGMIRRGAPADFVALEVRCSLSVDLRTILLAPDTRPVATFIAGEKVTL